MKTNDKTTDSVVAWLTPGHGRGVKALVATDPGDDQTEGNRFDDAAVDIVEHHAVFDATKKLPELTPSMETRPNRNRRCR